MSERPDVELLEAGTAEDFGIFYDRHSRAVLGFLYRRTADPETAADLAAETFAQAYLDKAGISRSCLTKNRPPPLAGAGWIVSFDGG